jgi:tRNA (guanine37-N1)-methyltransferase
MKINIITAFPDLFNNIYKISKNLRFCIENKKIQLNIINLREFGQIDDMSYGGNGIIYQFDTLSNALSLTKNNILLSPDGMKLNQNLVKELVLLKEITLVCCRYEGFDIRIVDKYIDFNISIGDYILSNGEIASLVLIDSVSRLCGVVKDKSLDDSFSKDRLDFDNYSKSKKINEDIPEVLKSGNHKKINEWKMIYSLFKTIFFRPDIIKHITKFEKLKLQELKNTIELILKNKVF